MEKHGFSTLKSTNLLEYIYGAWYTNQKPPNRKKV